MSGVNGDPILGTERIDNESGIHYFVGPGSEHGNAIVRDWDADDKKCAERFSGHKHDPGRIEIGLKNIRENSWLIKKSYGLVDVQLQNSDTVFLIGAGPSLHYFLDRLDAIHRRGTTLVTNRAAKAYQDEPHLADYFWLEDPEVGKAVGDFWDHPAYRNARVITSFSGDSGVLQDVGACYFFGHAVGTIPEWEATIEKIGIDKWALGCLDSGWCALFSQLHFIYKFSKLYDLKQIVLLGHDFALTDNHRYFDQPVVMDEAFQKTVADPAHQLLFSIDLNGHLIATQAYLARQMQLIQVACHQLKKKGLRVVNASGGGCLVSDSIEKISLDEIL